MGKDVFFRLKNNPDICRRMILWRFASNFLAVTRSAGQEITGVRSLIFDDTVPEKTGRRIEKIGKVHDHATNTFKPGFKLLVGLYWDGISAIPVDFAFFREKGKNREKPFGMSKKEIRRQYSKKRTRQMAGRRRVDELDMRKIEVAVQIFLMAVYQAFGIDYVLCDSWFTCSTLIHAVRSKKAHLIGMYKFTTSKFLYLGNSMNYKQINCSITQIKRCRRMKLHYKRADVMPGEVPLTLFFSRQGTRGKWKVLLTTDTKLSFLKLIEIYQIRWSIEVFFKESKQLLNLGGCQSGNFEAQIADTSVSMLAYILLAFRYRYNHYESMGELFRTMNQQRLGRTLDKRLWELFLELIIEICEVLELDIDDLIGKVMNCPKTKKLVDRLLQVPLPQTG